MSRGGIEPSTESACGGMDSKVARVIWEDQTGVYYICSDNCPIQDNGESNITIAHNKNFFLTILIN